MLVPVEESLYNAFENGVTANKVSLVFSWSGDMFFHKKMSDVVN